MTKIKALLIASVFWGGCSIGKGESLAAFNEIKEPVASVSIHYSVQNTESAVVVDDRKILDSISVALRQMKPLKLQGGEHSLKASLKISKGAKALYLDVGYSKYYGGQIREGVNGYSSDYLFRLIGRLNNTGRVFDR